VEVCHEKKCCTAPSWVFGSYFGSLGLLNLLALDYLPAIDERLVAALATQFPDVAPDIGLSDREIMFKAGQVSVVRWLASKLQDQQEVR
jgi:hypothetical protein